MVIHRCAINSGMETSSALVNTMDRFFQTLPGEYAEMSSLSKVCLSMYIQMIACVNFENGYSLEIFLSANVYLGVHARNIFSFSIRVF